MRRIAFPAVFVCALAACSDRPSLVEPATVASRMTAAAAQGRPIDVDETPFVVNSCAFPVEVQLSGKVNTIELPGGGILVTSPGLTATLTNLNNQNVQTFVITGSFNTSILKNGNVETVATGRNILLDPQVPGLAGLVLTIGRFSWVVDAQGNLVQPLQGTGQFIDVCALLA